MEEFITYEYEVTTRESMERPGKPRVYISGDMAVPSIDIPDFPGYGDEEALKAYDAAVKLHNRGQAAIWKEHVLRLQEEGRVPAGKIRFSMRAGCSCSCSPGFIIDTAELGLTEYFVTVSATMK